MTHFEHVASNILRMLGEEALDVKAIDGRPPVEAVVAAEGLAPAKIAPAGAIEALKPTSYGSPLPAAACVTRAGRGACCRRFSN